MSARTTLIRATALLVALAALPVARIHGFPRAASAVLVGLALWRMVIVAGGQPLVGRRARFVLQSAGSAAVLLLLGVAVRGAASPVVLILLLVSTVQGISLLGQQTPAVLFRLILLSTTQAAGAAFVVQDGAALGLALLYMLGLAAAVLFFERRLAEMRASEDRAVRGRIRVEGAALPLRAWMTALVSLTLVAAVVGGLLYVTAPRGFSVLARGKEDRGDAREADADGEAGAAADLGGGSFTGPDATAQGIRLGDVGRIKKDLTPYFEVSLPLGRRPFLRENTYDHYADAAWTMGKEEGVRPPRRIGPSTADDGWLVLAPGANLARGFHLGLRLYRGTHRRLYLERDCVRLRVLRDGRALPTALWRLDNEQMDSSLELKPEDRIEARIVPPRDDPWVLEQARSDHSTSPRASFLQLPAAAMPLKAVAEQVVGSETNPYRRAQRLIAWLGSDAFTYTLTMPEVNTDTPVVDFVRRVRRGHCEYFASSLTLMLRTLGHPARITKGFRGGDAQEGRGTWIVRGSHYHAWTEMHFEGVGWVPLDATPPDHTAVDAESITRVGEAAQEASAAWAQRFLGYGSGDHQALVAAFARGLDRVVVRPVVFLFSGSRLFLAVPLVLLLLLKLGRGRQRRRLAKRAGVRSVADLKGPYGAMLGLLAARGIRRARHQTPREFATHAARRVPDAEAALETLTAFHEAECYARRPADTEARRRAKGEIQTLQAALETGRARARPKRP